MRSMADEETETGAALNLIECYEQIERGDYVTLQTERGEESVLVEGMLWLVGYHKPLQIVSSRSRRYALGGDDRVVLRDKSTRGF